MSYPSSLRTVGAGRLYSQTQVNSLFPPIKRGTVHSAPPRTRPVPSVYSEPKELLGPKGAARVRNDGVLLVESHRSKLSARALVAQLVAAIEIH